jgi:anti-sigma factor RsiW
MTTPSFWSRLDDYIDGELSAAEAEELRQQLEGSPEQKREHELAAALREMLKHQPSHDPGEPYWEETVRLIQARTTEMAPAAAPARATKSTADQRSALYRALVSVAASLVIFFAALMIGSQSEQVAALRTESAPPILVAAALNLPTDDAGTPFFTERERADIVLGTLLMSSPGPVARLSGLPELTVGR